MDQIKVEVDLILNFLNQINFAQDCFMQLKMNQNKDHLNFDLIHGLILFMQPGPVDCPYIYAWHSEKTHKLQI